MDSSVMPFDFKTGFIEQNLMEKNEEKIETAKS